MEIEPRHRWGGALLLVLLIVFGAPEAASAQETAEGWIDRAYATLQPDGSMQSVVKLTTEDGFGGQRTLLLDFARHVDATGSRSLYEVREPEALEGSLFQITRDGDGPLVRRMWIPAFGQMVEVGGVHVTDPFLGTEFTYEDLTFTTPPEREEEGFERVQEQGETLIRVTSEPYHYYSRVVTRIDPDTGLPVRVTYYDRAGQEIREVRYEDVVERGIRRFPSRIVAHNPITGAESRLVFGHIDLQGDLPESFFAPSAIDRRIAASRERRAEQPAGEPAAPEPPS